MLFGTLGPWQAASKSSAPNARAIGPQWAGRRRRGNDATEITSESVVLNARRP
jgi:hypothetical protein